MTDEQSGNKDSPSDLHTIALVYGSILSNPDNPVVAPHDMTIIRGNKLLRVNVPLENLREADEVINCTNCLIMPGMINCHSHAGMGLLRGLADDLELERWLSDYIFPIEKDLVNPEFVYLSAMLSAVEMVLNGVTTFADGYYYMESTALAAIKVGIRAIVGQGILDVPTPDVPQGGMWRARALEFLESCPDDNLITPALFCHSPYLCGPDTMKASAELAADRSLNLFCHVAETLKEVEEIKTRFGVSPVEHLNDLGILGEKFVAVHCVHVGAHDMDLLAETKTKVVHCPESNMKLASGGAPIADMLRRSICVGVGTDGPASNNNLDLFEEMRAAALMGKLLTSNPRAVDARSVLRMATKGAAGVLCISEKVGSLQEGKL
ncbi:MAG: 5-methylthioadenosine/S-adenosylhomocysteine deaminase, partial [Thermodesulfobacteriota bacterium]|nr:5-methylthioadenosine/S-adenosylhomocysteine deaminase [Thermodesulfobacteriota bacterium]